MYVRVGMNNKTLETTDFNKLLLMRTSEQEYWFCVNAAIHTSFTKRVGLELDGI